MKTFKLLTCIIAFLLLANVNTNAQKNWEPINLPWEPETIIFKEDGSNTVRVDRQEGFRFDMRYSFELEEPATLVFTSTKTQNIIGHNGNVMFYILEYGETSIGDPIESIATISGNGSCNLPDGSYYLIINAGWQMVAIMGGAQSNVSIKIMRTITEIMSSTPAVLVYENVTDQEILGVLTNLTITGIFEGGEIELENSAAKWEIAEDKLSATYTATAPTGYKFAENMETTITVAIEYIESIVITKISSSANRISVNEEATERDILMELEKLIIKGSYEGEDGEETVVLANSAAMWNIAEDKLSAIYTAIAPQGYVFAEDLETTITITINYSSGINETSFNSATIYVQNHNIMVRNAKTGSHVSVFDITGRAVADAVVSSSEVCIPIAESGIYIVRTGMQTIKVVCK